MRLVVVPVGFAQAAPPATAMVDAACDLFAGWSGGRLRPAVTTLPPLALSEPASIFTALGGMTALGGPLLAARASAHAEARAVGRDPLVLVARGAFHPHCWRAPVPAGGARYALLPENAPALTAAHELGHLLLGWRDAPGAGAHCLMGAGNGAPGAWLRVAGGWDTPHAIGPHATPSALHGIGSWGGLLVERRGAELLAWHAADRVCAIPLAPGDEARPILALLAAQGVHPVPPESPRTRNT
jgi:hypothetical protein